MYTTFLDKQTVYGGIVRKRGLWVNSCLFDLTSHASIIFTYQRIAYFVSGTLQALGKLVVPEV